MLEIAVGRLEMVGCRDSAWRRGVAFSEFKTLAYSLDLDKGSTIEW